MVALHISVSAAKDITVINKLSQNLHAELLLRLLGKVHGTEGSFAEGARVVRQFITSIGVDDNDFFLYDGSGTSMDDRVAPRVYTKLLTWVAKQPWGQAWRETLPIAGVDGTLNNRFRNSPLKGKPVGQDGHAERSRCPVRLSDHREGEDAGLLHHGERPSAGQHRRSTGYRANLRGHCRRGMTVTTLCSAKGPALPPLRRK